MGKNNGTSFLKGAMLGVAAGVAAGILFAPKSGKETREDIKNAAAKLSADAQKLYMQARKTLETKIAAMEKLGKSLDKDKYMALVQEVLDELKKEKKVSPEIVSEVGKQLGTDWNKVQKALKA